MEDAVHGSDEPRTDGLDSPGKRVSACGFDDQVHVVAFNSAEAALRPLFGTLLVLAAYPHSL